MGQRGAFLCVILTGVCWISWTYRFIFYVKFRKFSPLFLRISFPYPPLLLQLQLYLYRLLDILHMSMMVCLIPEVTFSFLLCFEMLLCYIFKIINIFSDISNLLLISFFFGYFSYSIFLIILFPSTFVNLWRIFIRAGLTLSLNCTASVFYRFSIEFFPLNYWSCILLWIPINFLIKRMALYIVGF